MAIQMAAPGQHAARMPYPISPDAVQVRKVNHHSQALRMQYQNSLSETNPNTHETSYFGAPSSPKSF